MRKIKRLARNFRDAIDMAFDRHELTSYPPFSEFPRECCEHTCDLLAQYLSENNIETIQVNGVYRYDETRRHVWLLTKDGIVIDITGDQFANNLVSSQDVEIVHVGSEGTIHKLFSLERELQQNTIFNDENEYTGFGGRPNPRQQRLQDVYEIICRYL